MGGLKYRAGWLEDITNWLKDAILSIWQAIVDFFRDLIVWLVDGVMSFAAIVINAIPAPDFLHEYSLGGVLGAAGPTVGWIASSFRIGEAFAIIGAAYTFRLMRKALTLFQW